MDVFFKFLGCVSYCRGRLQENIIFIVISTSSLAALSFSAVSTVFSARSRQKLSKVCMYPDKLWADWFSLLPRRICSAVGFCPTDENLPKGTWATELCPSESWTEILVHPFVLEMRMVSCRVTRRLLSPIEWCVSFRCCSMNPAILPCPLHPMSQSAQAFRNLWVSNEGDTGTGPLWGGLFPSFPCLGGPRIACTPSEESQMPSRGGPPSSSFCQDAPCPKLPAESGCVSLTLMFAFWLFPQNEPGLWQQRRNKQKENFMLLIFLNNMNVPDNSMKHKKTFLVESEICFSLLLCQRLGNKYLSSRVEPEVHPRLGCCPSEC